MRAVIVHYPKVTVGGGGWSVVTALVADAAEKFAHVGYIVVRMRTTDTTTTTQPPIPSPIETALTVKHKTPARTQSKCMFK